MLACCAGVPLALRIAAARLAGRTGWTLAALADRLDDERHRLDELTLGDLAVRTAFHTSYRNLPGTSPAPAPAPAGTGPRTGEAGAPGQACAARAFRLLGLFPSTRITAHATAALLDLPLRPTERLLDTLVEAHLVEPDGPHHYRLHDLLRAHAAELAHHEDTAAQRRAACTRLAGWYLHACHQAQAAMNIFHPDVDVSGFVRSEPTLVFVSHDGALAWLDAEQPNLPAVTRLATDLDLGPLIWLLRRCVLNYQLLRALWHDLIGMSELAAAAARAHGATEVLPGLLSTLSLPHARLGRFDHAVELCQEAFEIAGRLGQTRDAAYSATVLADALANSGRFAEAEPWYQRGIELYRSSEVPHELGKALNNMAWAYLEVSRPREAVALAAEAIDLARATGDRQGVAAALDTLGMAYRALGRLDDALAALGESVQDYTDTDSYYLGADALDHYADTLAGAHRHEDAHKAWAQAATWFDTTDAPRAATIRAKARQTADHETVTVQANTPDSE
ncbi:tetratricopeptide repeat protein [Kitasatospora kifunensis]|uniref:Tetratricopeptide (TPR) repeat protein n=1 Tax=Kitasatospora kifunensis TaxID=58351 RepID=A0A7W7W051_KITKI|nr:tetratricopeptide repeat protein [Kitasatospora kifunensis]MBB4928103.1 tetratricopeptide (TPR) repeat protein [Kitasatospora kifunensis]MBB4928320.1 tetratricopeptide (TPR) repeat protein [Kitasatospora kifunensis]